MHVLYAFFAALSNFANFVCECVDMWNRLSIRLGLMKAIDVRITLRSVRDEYLANRIRESAAYARRTIAAEIIYQLRQAYSAKNGKRKSNAR